MKKFKVLLLFLIMFLLVGCEFSFTDDPVKPEPEPPKELYIVDARVDEDTVRDPFVLGKDTYSSIGFIVTYNNGEKSYHYLNTNMLSSEEFLKLNTVGRHNVKVDLEGYTFRFNITIIENINEDLYYKVTFIVDGESSFIRVLKNTKLGEIPNEPTKTQHNFVGWYLEDELFDFNKIIERDIILVARFVKRDEKIVKFKYNILGISDEEIIINTGDRVERPYTNDISSEDEHLVIVGWLLNGELFDFNEEVYEDITLEAKYVNYIDAYLLMFSVNINGDYEYYEQLYASKEELVQKPTIPIIEGYSFYGWLNNGKLFDIEREVITSDTYLEAVYINDDNPQTYTVTFYIGIELYKEETVVIGDNATNIVLEDREGYKFSGWYLKDELYTFEDGIFESIELKARYTKYTPKYYTVSFDTGIDLYVKPQSVLEGEIANEPNIGSFNDELIGWYLEDELFDFNTPITKDIHLVAKWKGIMNFDVTFDSDNGDNLIVRKYLKGELIVKIADPKKFDYEFLGWYLEDELFDFNTPVTENIDLVAKWQQKQYSVTYYLEGELYGEVEYYYRGDSYTLRDKVHKDGFIFVGWEGDVFSQMPARDLVYYGSYRVRPFTVKFYQIKSGYSETQYILPGEAAVAPEPEERTGYTFVKWDYDYTNIREDVVIRGVYEANEYLITLVFNNGLEEKVETVKYYESFYFPEITKEGHKLDGWYYNDEKNTNSISYTYDYDIKVEARWIPLEYYLFFKINNKTYGNSLKYTYGTEIDYPEYNVEEGYTFSGWSIEGYDNLPTHMPAKNLYVEATYTANKYTITYYLNDEFYDERTHTYNSYLYLIADPKEVGYRFSGWSIEGYDNLPTHMPAYNLELYAYTEKISTVVTFLDDDDSVILVKEYEYGSKIGDDYPKLEREGYAFGGWYDGNYKFNTHNRTITEDYTLKASYDILYFKIIYIVDDELFYDGTYYAYGADFYHRHVEAEIGHSFTGWHFEDGTKVPDDYKIEKGIKVYGSFKINKYEVSYYIDRMSKKIELEYGTDLSVINTDYPGITFIRWLKDNPNDMTEITHVPNYNIRIKAEIIVHMYDVKFLDYDDTLIKEFNVRYGEYDFNVTPSEKIGHTFIGWDVDVVNISENITARPIYKLNEYRIYFNNDIFDYMTVTYGDLVVLPILEKKNYIFLGWKDNFMTNEENLLTEFIYEYTTNITIVPIYTNQGVYFLHDLLNNQVTTIIAIPLLIITLPTPEKEGYRFDGWYLDGTRLPQEIYREFTGRLDIYAKWTYLLEEFEMDIIDGKATLIKYNGTDSIVNIPYEYKNQDVEVIGSNAFSDNSNITKINIHRYITKIEEDAFNNLSELVEIVFPDVYINYSYGIFNQLPKLEKISLRLEHQNKYVSDLFKDVPSSLEIIEAYTIDTINSIGDINEQVFVILPRDEVINRNQYANISSLVNIIIPNTVKSIEYNAFYHTKNLKEVKFEEGSILTNIESRAFERNYALIKITLPSSIETLAEEVFINSDSLEEVIFSENSNYQILTSNIFYKSSLKRLVLPDSIHTINDNALSNLILEEVIVSETSNLSHIGKNAFYKTKLSRFDVPENVITIDEYAFSRTRLSELNFLGESKLEYIGSYAFSNANLRNVIIPDTVTYLGSSIFDGTTLRSLVTPFIGRTINDTGKYGSINYLYYEIEGMYPNINILNNVIEYLEITKQETIHSNALYGSGILSEVVLHNVINIDDYAFIGAYELERVHLNEGLERIGNYAFETSFMVELSVNFPSTLKSIGEYAFKSSNIIIDTSIASGLEKIDDYAFSEAKLIEGFNIPSNVKVIGDYAFSEAVFNGKLIIPESVEEIGNYAFYSVKELEGILVIGSNIETIGDYAFYGIETLSELIIEDSDNDLIIGDYSFSSIIGLEVLELSNRLVNIPKGAFYNSNLITSLVIRNTTKSIDENAFRSMSSVNELIFEENTTLEYIGDYAFYGLNEIESITVPITVDHIGVGAFSNMFYLKNATILNVNGYYSEEIFSQTPKLEELTIPFIGDKYDRDISSYSLEYLIGNKTNNLKTINITVQNIIYSNNFKNIVSLLNINFTNDVMLVQSNAFSGLDNITSLEFTNKDTILEAGAFNGMNYLESLTIPYVGTYSDQNNKEAVLYNLFGRNAGIDSYFVSGYIKMPNSFRELTVLYQTKLTNGGLNKVKSLEVLNLPASLTEISFDEFIGMDSLIDINMSDNNEYYRSVDGVLYNKDLTTLIKYGDGRLDREYIVEDHVNTLAKNSIGSKHIKSLIINNNVTKIEEGALFGLSNLEKISSPVDSSTSRGTFSSMFGDEEFLNTYRNSDVYPWYYIPYSLKEIEITNETILSPNSFFGMKEIETLIIGEATEVLSMNAFYNMEKLNKLVLPNNLKNFSYEMFDNNPSLKEVNVSDENTMLTSVDGVLYSKDLSELIYYPEGKEDLSHELALGLEEIVQNAFRTNHYLETLIIPEGVINVRKGAFKDVSIKNINIPTSLTNSSIKELINIASLENIIVNDHHSLYQSIDGVLYSNDMKRLYKLPENKEIEHFKVLEGVEVIEVDAIINIELLMTKVTRFLGTEHT